MSEPARVNQMLDDLDRRERLYRSFGLDAMADRLVIDTALTIGGYRRAFAAEEAQVTPVRRVGIFKGGL